MELTILYLYGVVVWECEARRSCTRLFIETSSYKECVLKKAEMKAIVEGAGRIFAAAFCGRSIITIEPRRNQ